MKPQINRCFQVLGLASVIALGIGSILGSGGSGSSAPPTPPANTNFVVFMADKDTDGVTELYKYSLQSGTVDKVNTDLVTGRAVTSFSISPDRQWIAYIADQDTNDVYELYVRDAALSSAPIKLSTILPAGVGVSSDPADKPRWAPDSSRVAFRHNAQNALRFELNTVSPTGGAVTAVTISMILNDNRNVQAGSFAWSPDSSYVAYLADQDAAGVIELYTNLGNAASSVSNNNKISGLSTDANRAVTEYAWSPDSAYLAYRADQGGTDNQFSLYTSTATGVNNTEVAQLNGIPGANMNANVFAWAPDSTRIAFIANRTGAPNDIYNIYTVHPSATNPTQIDNGIGTTYDVVGTPSWAPDSSRVAYIADISSDEVFELYSSFPTSSFSYKINGLLSSGTDVETSYGSHLSPPAWSPDSTSLIYVADQGGAGKMEVYVGAADGSGSATGNTRVSGTPMAGGASLSGDVESWSPNGNYVLYRADQLAAGTDELFTSTSTGTVNTILTRSSPTATALKSYGKWAPDSSYVAYASTQDTGTAVIELFIATPAGTITNISGTIAGSVGVNPDTFAWAP